MGVDTVYPAFVSCTGRSPGDCIVGLVFRLIQLMEEIMAEKENKTIIFVETKRRCDDLTRRMRRDG